MTPYLVKYATMKVSKYFTSCLTRSKQTAHASNHISQRFLVHRSLIIQNFILGNSVNYTMQEVTINYSHVLFMIIHGV